MVECCGVRRSGAEADRSGFFGAGEGQRIIKSICL